MSNERRSGSGVSPSALSHAIHGLEERLGVRLFARTTRSVAPTMAGEQFVARLGPALADVTQAVVSNQPHSGRSSRHCGYRDR